MPSVRKGAYVELWGAVIAWLSVTSSPASRWRHRERRNCIHSLSGPGIDRKLRQWRRMQMFAHMIFRNLGTWWLMGRIGMMFGGPLNVLVKKKIVDWVTIVLIAKRMCWVRRNWCRKFLIWLGVIMGIVAVGVLVNFTAWSSSDCYGEWLPWSMEKGGLIKGYLSSKSLSLTYYIQWNWYKISRHIQSHCLHTGELVYDGICKLMVDSRDCW